MTETQVRSERIEVTDPPPRQPDLLFNSDAERTIVDEQSWRRGEPSPKRGPIKAFIALLGVWLVYPWLLEGDRWDWAKRLFDPVHRGWVLALAVILVVAVIMWLRLGMEDNLVDWKSQANAVRKLGTLALLLGAIAIFASTTAFGNPFNGLFGDQNGEKKAAATTETKCGKDTFFDKKAGECRSLDAVVQKDAEKDGWDVEKGEVRSGNDVQHNADKTERSANNSFVDTTIGDGDGVLESNEEIREWINSDSSKAKAARARLKAVLSDHDYKRALKGEGYYPRQHMLAAQISGTTYEVDGKAVTMDATRAVGTKDVIWLYVDENGRVIREASLRADCANPSFHKIVPVRPDTPPAPPVECRVNCKPPPPQPPPPGSKKCANGGATGPGMEPCGSSRDGDDQNPRVDPGGTPGYDPGNAEEIVAQQPRHTDEDDPPDPNGVGYDSGSDNGAPTGQHTDPDGNESNGSNQGTDDPDTTEGSGQTSDPGSDPGGF